MSVSIGSLSITDVKADFGGWLPHPLVAALLDSYRQIKENFYLGKHEPSELNAGKLCEVVFRILEHETSHKHTPLGTSIRNLPEKFRSFENYAAANDTVRFHLPRLAVAVYNIRNKRGVGHIGGDVNPNLADATLVTTAADWIMAELLRLHYACSIEQAQKWVDGLVQRKLLLVYAVGDMKRVLNPSLRFPQKVLLFLAAEFPSGVKDETLFSWCEHSNFTVFKSNVLRQLHRKRLIEYGGAACTILPPGIRVVEDNYENWCNFSPAL